MDIHGLSLRLLFLKLTFLKFAFLKLSASRTVSRQSWLGLMLWSLTAATYADIVVIGHPQAPVLKKHEVEQIFLAKTKAFPNGKRVQPIDLPESEKIRDSFYMLLTNKNPMQLKAYWSRLVFTGSAKPPPKMDDSDELIEAIADNPELIGYIDIDDINDSVKVLYSVSEHGG